MKPGRVAFLFLLLGAAGTQAQQYVVSTHAGGGPPPAQAPGVNLSIGYPGFSMATDAAGNLYFASLMHNCVFKLDPNGVATRIAGSSRAGYSGDGGPAMSAQLSSPLGVAVDGAGNLFIADRYRIRRVSPDGIITTVAGNGTSGGSSGDAGDGGPATGAQLSDRSIAVDRAGNLFIADAGNNSVREVSPNGIVTTVAGNGTPGFSGDGKRATSAQLNGPAGVAVDGAGNLFIADTGNNLIREVGFAGIIITVAGNGMQGFSGDGKRATSAQLSDPVGVAVDGAGNLFIADGLNNRIRKVSHDGVITTVAGNGTPGLAGDGGPATQAQVEVSAALAVDNAGNLYVEGGSTIRKISPSGIITTVAGPGACCSSSGDGGLATGAQIFDVEGVAVDGAGNLFLAESGNNRIRKVTPDGIITTVAGSSTPGFSGDGGPATSAQLAYPSAVAVDGAGNLFIADTNNNRIRQVSPDGTITTVAGNGSGGNPAPPIGNCSHSLTDGGPATQAEVCQPTAVAVDGAGNLFITDTVYTDGYDIYQSVRKVSASGTITTVAGTTCALNDPYHGCDGGDNAPAGGVSFGQLNGLAVDGAGNLFIAEFGASILKASPDGTITTVAGGGNGGDGGPATSAQLYASGVAVDSAGNLFIADANNNNRIRKVSPDGIITTVAGGGKGGDGGPATSAQLSLEDPTGVAVDGAGNIYVVTDLQNGVGYNNVVRVLRPTTQSVFVGAVVDAVNPNSTTLSPGKIMVIYGAGLGPSALVQNQPGNGQFGTQLGGTTVSFNGIAAPILYTSATQVAAAVPYAVTGTRAQVTVTYQGQVSAAFTAPMASSAPSLFTPNQTGAGQAAALNAADGTVNTATNPVKIGDSISLYAAGEGQTVPAAVDGQLAGPAPIHPLLPVSVTVGGIPATVQSAVSLPGQLADLMQVTVQIPSGVKPGGYVPVVLQVGNATTTPGAVWISVSAN